MRTLDEITVELLTDTRPGLDGCSNADRVYYIAEVMECGPIDVNQVFDFGPAIRGDDPELVEAARQLATLQLDYVGRLYANDHLEKHEYEVKSAYLILDIQKLNWHMRHLREGKATPPFPFIH